MSEYISREAFLEKERRLYCQDCSRRKNSKGKIVYEIGDAPCRACGIGDVLDDLEDIPAADVRPRWIPVSERLPETGVDVLVKFPQNMAVASIDIGEWVVNSGDGWCTDINLAGGEKNPTHWMPLPKGPDEE